MRCFGYGVLHTLLGKKSTDEPTDTTDCGTNRTSGCASCQCTCSCSRNGLKNVWALLSEVSYEPLAEIVSALNVCKSALVGCGLGKVSFLLFNDATAQLFSTGKAQRLTAEHLHNIDATAKATRRKATQSGVFNALHDVIQHARGQGLPPFSLRCANHTLPSCSRSFNNACFVVLVHDDAVDIQLASGGVEVGIGLGACRRSHTRHGELGF